MLILLEGHDNSGKTTIGLALAKLINFPYLKYSNVIEINITKDLLSHINICSSMYGLTILKSLGNPNLIIDRQYPSEYAYGKVFRNTKFEDIKYIDTYLVENFKEHLIIITEKSINIQKANDFVLCKDYEPLKEAYREFVSKSGANCLILDTTDQNLEKQLGIIKVAIEKQKGNQEKA